MNGRMEISQNHGAVLLEFETSNQSEPRVEWRSKIYDNVSLYTGLWVLIEVPGGNKT